LTTCIIPHITYSLWVGNS